MFFQFLQLRHAVAAQFPTFPTIKTDLLSMLIEKDLPKPLFSIYSLLSPLTIPKMDSLCNKLHVEIPSLSKEDRLLQYVPTMKSDRDRFIQLKCIHRVYYTPQRRLALVVILQRARLLTCFDLAPDYVLSGQGYLILLTQLATCLFLWTP